MQKMGSAGLRRILLTSEKVPYEFGILGLDDVSSFLLPSATDHKTHE